MKVCTALLLFGLALGASTVANTIPTDDILGELDKMDCLDEKDLFNAQENEASPTVLCPKTIERLALSPLGDFGTDQNGVSGYLEETYYKPLAFSMIRRNNLADMLNDLIFLDPKLFALHGQVLQDNYSVFRNSITDLFASLAAKTPDIRENKEVVNQLIVDILKHFHVYWNTLRFKNQFNRAKEDTKNVMREIVNTYDQKLQFLSEVTRVVVEKLKDAYFRFLRAHKMLAVLNANASSILAGQVLRRYQTVTNAIKDKKNNANVVTKEIFFLLRIVQCFHVVNYKNGLNEPSSISKFNSDIFIPIEMEYQTLRTITANDPYTQKLVRDFTATLLLKCKHLIFVIFYYHNISEVVNQSQLYFEFDYKRTTQIYNEVTDHMMMIPKTCVNFLALKNCVLHETNKVLRYISVKYEVKRSTSGWEIYEYLKMMLHLLYRQLDPLSFSNWSVFKQSFYQNLFAVMKNFQKHFYIRDDETIDDLQNFIGTAIMKFKNDYVNEIPDFGTIDILERDLYRFFIEQKGEFNHDAPIDHNMNALTTIVKRLKTFMHFFLQKYKNNMDDRMVTIVKVIEDTAKHWFEYTTSKPATSIQVSNIVTPFVTNVATATFTSVDPVHAQTDTMPGFFVHPPSLVTRNYAPEQIIYGTNEYAKAAPPKGSSDPSVLAHEAIDILDDHREPPSPNTSSDVGNLVGDSAVEGAHRTV